MAMNVSFRAELNDALKAAAHMTDARHYAFQASQTPPYKIGQVTLKL